LRWVTSQSGTEIPYSIKSVWELGESPIRTESDIVTLGAAVPIYLGQSPFDSPMVWTGSLKSFLAGMANSSSPNCIYVEIEFNNANSDWIKLMPAT